MVGALCQNHMKTSELIYLDNNATTRVDPAVVEESSLTKAAERYNIANSAVSKRISFLEKTFKIVSATSWPIGTIVMFAGMSTGLIGTVSVTTIPSAPSPTS